MTLHRLAAVLGILALGIMLTTGTAGRAQPEPPQPGIVPPAADDPQQDGIEVQARGPIHEAYANPIQATPQATAIVPKEPPPPIEELPPDQKPAGENVQWFPGYWAWDDDRSDFLWISGIWRVPPPGRNWVPGHWVRVDTGWQWTPGFWMVLQPAGAAQQIDNTIQYLPPPPAPIAAVASIPAPNPDSVFIPGVWVYRDTRYLWRPGFWIDYRPGWVWIPAHYVWTPIGYVFVEGYWDLELSRRGLVFAPVYFRRPLWAVASWFYRPRYIVYDDFLLTALFVRPGCYSYYFGDYFEPAYRRLGFTAWIDFRFGRSGYDPLFSYYRWSYRDDRGWSRELSALYAARSSGQAPRPPRTLVQQTTIIQNITNNNVTNNVTNLRNVTALASLSNVNRNVVKLQPVPQAQLQQEQRLAQNLRQASVNRGKVEAQLLAAHSVATTTNARPVAAKVDLPKPRVPNNALTRLQPPPAPITTHVATNPVTPANTGKAGVPPTRTDARGSGMPKGESMPKQAGTTKLPVDTAPKTLPKTEIKPPPKPESKPPMKVEPRPEPKSQPKTEPKKPPVTPEARPAPATQPKTDPKKPPMAVQTRPAPAPQPRVEPRPQPYVEAKPQPHVTPQPRIEPKPQPHVTPQPQPRIEPKLQPHVEPRPQPRPQPRFEPARSQAPSHPPAQPPKHDRPPDHKN